MDIAVLLEPAGGHKVRDPIKIGRADYYVGATGEFFDGDIQKNPVFECLDDAAEGFHINRGVGAERGTVNRVESTSLAASRLAGGVWYMILSSVF